MKVIGYERKNGTFKDESGIEREYDNMHLYCTYKTPNTVGSACKEYKLARDCHYGNFNSLDDVIDHEVDLSTVANKYGVKVTAIYIRE